MFTKTTAFTVSLTLFALAGCGGLEEPSGQPAGQPPLLLVNPQPGVTPILRASLQSACKNHGSETDSLPGGLSFSLEPGGTLTVVHLDLEANCAAKLASKATVTLPVGSNAGKIAIEEWVTNPEQAADCICRFDLTTTISGLAPGSYQVTALGPDGELAGPTPVSVAAVAALPTVQSGCKAQANAAGVGSTLKTSLQGSTVTVEQLDVEANCAAKIESRATVTPPTAGAPGSIKIEQVITNPEMSANCVCHFDLKATIANLAPGTYSVTAVDPSGALSGPVTVVVP